jgi:hypothetical protein
LEEGRKLLRFSNHIANTGAGVLELFPGPLEYSMCGDPAMPGRLVYQRVYKDVGGLGYYNGRVTTEFSEEMIGCMLFHPEHEHWHFNAFTLFELQDDSGAVVRGGKTSTCLMDSERGFNLPGAPSNARYLYADCDQHTAQGISIGWVDRYGWDLPDQYIDITDVPDGAYCLVSTADPDGQVMEANASNNTASLYVEIVDDTVRPQPERPCPGESEPNPGPRVEATSSEVFHDTLHWHDWSWDTTVDQVATGRVYEGRWAMSVTYNAPWASLSLGSMGFDTSGYTHLELAIHPDGQPWPAIEIVMLDAADIPQKPVSLWLYAELAQDGWYTVRIPLADLGVENMTITEIEFKEDSGGPQPLFYLGGIDFTKVTRQ